MSGLTSGILEAIDIAAQTIRVGQRVFQVGSLIPTELQVGQRVAVTWDDAGDCQAGTVVIEQPQDSGAVAGGPAGGVGSIETAGGGGGVRHHIAPDRSRRYGTPKGHAIDRKGVTPDVVVDDAPAQADLDPQLERALQILKVAKIIGHYREGS
jgi:hypothetical protein